MSPPSFSFANTKLCTSIGDILDCTNNRIGFEVWWQLIEEVVDSSDRLVLLWTLSCWCLHLIARLLLYFLPLPFPLLFHFFGSITPSAPGKSSHFSDLYFFIRLARPDNS